MSRHRVINYAVCFAFLFALLFGLAGGHIALAAQEGGSGSFSLSPNQEEPPPDVLELKCKYPVLRGVSGHNFEF